MDTDVSSGLNVTPLAGGLLDDRCDKCGAAAVVVAVLPDGALHFCNHHARSYGRGLAEAGARVISRPAPRTQQAA